MSLLLKTTRKNVLEPYDFRMNIINGQVNPLNITAINMQADDNLQLHNINYRFIAGIRYQIKKMGVGLKYQHSLRSIEVGGNSNKNHTIAIDIQYKIN